MHTIPIPGRQEPNERCVHFAPNRVFHIIARSVDRTVLGLEITTWLAKTLVTDIWISFLVIHSARNFPTFCQKKITITYPGYSRAETAATRKHHTNVVHIVHCDSIKPFFQLKPPLLYRVLSPVNCLSPLFFRHASN